MYLPLVDAKPSDPSTMMTAAVKAMQLTEQTGQEYTLMTCDQQLYKILVDIKWAFPEKFKNFIPRLGGMHFLMSFIGCCGTLMTNSGLSELLRAAFGNVDKMLLGKNFLQNFRALRLVVEELLRGSIEDMIKMGDLTLFLDNISKQCPTSKLWVDNLIRSVLYMMLFVRAEREGDWPLHLYVVSKMMPYFSQQNYAQYGLYYMHDMKKLPAQVLERFMRGEHVTTHQKGLWNGIWTDMFIETTFMQYGKGPGGLIGLTLKAKVVKKWAYGLKTCIQINEDLEKMRKTTPEKNQVTHKEEGQGRIKADGQDRSNIQKKLEVIIHPLRPNQHSNELLNIASGKFERDSSVKVGSEQMKKFYATFPDGFYSPIQKKVQLMKPEKKCTIGDVEVYSTEAIYARIICLMSTSSITLEDVLKYELAPVPTALFDENGDIRSNKQKSELKNTLQVDVSNRHIHTEAVVIDGNAVLWSLHWPSKGLVEDLAEVYLSYVMNHLTEHDVFLVFDRYHD